MFKVFVDGNRGTTGLNVCERLNARDDVELLTIDPDKRKDPAERKRLINSADIVFLCLPDDAARDAVAMVENPATRVIDASTAHRTVSGWAYGLPELSDAHLRLSKPVPVLPFPDATPAVLRCLFIPLLPLGSPRRITPLRLSLLRALQVAELR